MQIPDQAFDVYLAMWNATDEMRCRELADQVLTEAAVVRYPALDADVRAEVVTVAARFHQDTPGVQTVLISGVEHHHGWARGAWRVMVVDGSAR